MGGMVLVDAHQPIPTYVFSGILDQVKNKLLDFVLGLEENNVTPEDLANRTVEPEVVRNLFYITIQGDHNTVANGEHVNQQVSSVQKGDMDSLLNRLRELNVDDEDLRELEDIVSVEPEAPGGNYGPRMRAWLGGMITRASTGLWKIGVEAASKELTEALSRYY